MNRLRPLQGSPDLTRTSLRVLRHVPDHPEGLANRQRPPRGSPDPYRTSSKVHRFVPDLTEGPTNRP